MFIMFFSDEGPTLETLDFAIRTPTILYFDSYLNAAVSICISYYVYLTMKIQCFHKISK